MGDEVGGGCCLLLMIAGAIIAVGALLKIRWNLI